MIDYIVSHLGDRASFLLDHTSTTIPKSHLHLPSPTSVDDVFGISDRNNRVLGNLQRMTDSGRLSGTGYTSILPVDQGIEHSAGASFAKIRHISILRILSSWLLKVVAMRLHQHLGYCL